eukprot:5199423-Pyramimonas_sp.AAC.1
MRFINIAGYIDGPYRAIRGVVAGCSMATTFVRIYYIRSFSSVPLYPSTSLDLYIDDIGLIAA